MRESLGATAMALMSLSCAEVAAVAFSFAIGASDPSIGLAARVSRAEAMFHTFSSLSAPADTRCFALLQHPASIHLARCGELTLRACSCKAEPFIQQITALP